MNTKKKIPIAYSVRYRVFSIQKRVGDVGACPCIRSAVKSVVSLAKPGLAGLSGLYATLARKVRPGKAWQPWPRPGYRGLLGHNSPAFLAMKVLCSLCQTCQESAALEKCGKLGQSWAIMPCVWMGCYAAWNFCIFSTTELMRNQFSSFWEFQEILGISRLFSTILNSAYSNEYQFLALHFCQWISSNSNLKHLKKWELFHNKHIAYQDLDNKEFKTARVHNFCVLTSIANEVRLSTLPILENLGR